MKILCTGFIIDSQKVRKKIFTALFLGLTFAIVFILLMLKNNLKMNSLTNLSNLTKNILGIVKFDDPESIIQAELPIISLQKKSMLAKVNNLNSSKKCAAQNTKSNKSSTANFAPIKVFDLSERKISKTDANNCVSIKNETSYEVNANEILNSKLNMKIDKKELSVLILHTHNTESYMDKDGSVIDRSLASGRDENLTVSEVGEIISSILNKSEIKTFHDKTRHEGDDSYANSLKTVEKYKEKYPSINIVLDIHRDSITVDDDTSHGFVKPVAKINGKNCAECMIVVGTDENGLEHENWRKNLIFAAKLQKFIESKNSGLMRPINLRKERFNQHMTPGSIIIEIGANTNTIEEAKNSATLLGNSIAEFLKSIGNNT